MTAEGQALVSIGLAELGRELSQLRLCSDAAVAELARSLQSDGQVTPVLVYRAGDKLEVINGFKRLRAAGQLGWSELRVELRELDPAEATWLVWQTNAGTRVSEIEQAWIIRSLYRKRGLNQSQIGARFGRHKSWVCRRLLLAEGLSEGIEASLRLGLVSPTTARELARLPRCNQDQIGAWVSRRGLTSRQSAQLVDKLLVAAPDRWSELLEAHKAPRRTAEPGCVRSKPTPAESLLSSAEALKRACVRFEVRLMQRPTIAADNAETALLTPSLGELRASLAAVARLLDARLPAIKEVSDGLQTTA